jgi:hypothetical protein
MPKPTTCPVLTDEGEKAVAKVQRVNQRWIVHGKLRDNASAYIDYLERTDPARLLRACDLALHLVHHKKAVILRDPKPLFYAGLFAEASRAEIERFLKDHPMTRCISLLRHGDDSGLAALSGSGSILAESIAREIREVEPSRMVSNA